MDNKDTAVIMIFRYLSGECNIIIIKCNRYIVRTLRTEIHGICYIDASIKMMIGSFALFLIEIG